MYFLENFTILILFYSAKSPLRCLLLRKVSIQEVGKKYPKDLKTIKSLAFYRHKYFLHAKKHKKEGIDGGDPETYFSLYNPIRHLSDSRFTESVTATATAGFSFKKVTQDALSRLREKEKEYNQTLQVQKSNTATIHPLNAISNSNTLSPESFANAAKPRTLPPLTKDELDKILKPSTFANFIQAIPKLNDSDVETLPSEESEGSGDEDNGDDDDDDDIYSDNSELNYSDVYPLESFEMMFNEPSGGENVITYLEVNNNFSI